jgi:hypothetical protein
MRRKNMRTATALPPPISGVKEFKARISSAYKKYASSKPSAVENRRLRPKNKDIFKWLMEDPESTRIADSMIEKAGLKW